MKDIKNNKKEVVKELKENIGTYIGEWLNIYLNNEHWIQKNPMVYCEGKDQNKELEKIAKFIIKHPSIEIYASSSKIW